MPITGRIVMGELEKYFSGKVITEPFETFLAVLILIHCVEKYTWLYRSREQDCLMARSPLEKARVSSL